jgi:hypothetical protein
MTAETQWQNVTLYDYVGKIIGRCRVPKNPFLPSIILWSNRHFRMHVLTDSYIEAYCYLVPVDHMYAGAGPAAKPGGGSEKP